MMSKWHRFLDFFGCKPTGGYNSGFDGASNTDRCKRCGLRILQDSQGGWFPASIQDKS